MKNLFAAALLSFSAALSFGDVSDTGCAESPEFALDGNGKYLVSGSFEVSEMSAPIEILLMAVSNGVGREIAVLEACEAGKISICESFDSDASAESVSFELIPSGFDAELFNLDIKLDKLKTDAASGESVGGRNASSSGENAMLYYFLCNGYVYGDFAAGKERAEKSTGLGFVEAQNAEQDSIIYVDGHSGNDSNSGSFKFPKKTIRAAARLNMKIKVISISGGEYAWDGSLSGGTVTIRPTGTVITAGQMIQEVLL